jgi:hypothetical protein
MDAQYTKYTKNLSNLQRNYKLHVKNSKIQNNRPTSEYQLSIQSLKRTLALVPLVPIIIFKLIY